jgi:hypothetical protein
MHEGRHSAGHAKTLLQTDKSAVASGQVNLHQTNKNSCGNNRPLSIDQVSPELAAQIIKQYVLPMFDRDKKVPSVRKGSKSKGDKKGAPIHHANTVQPVDTNPLAGKSIDTKPIDIKPKKTVLEDLQLTQNLFD